MPICLASSLFSSTRTEAFGVVASVARSVSALVERSGTTSFGAYVTSFQTGLIRKVASRGLMVAICIAAIALTPVNGGVTILSRLFIKGCSRLFVKRSAVSGRNVVG